MTKQEAIKLCNNRAQSALNQEQFYRDDEKKSPYKKSNKAIIAQCKVDFTVYMEAKKIIEQMDEPPTQPCVICAGQITAYAENENGELIGGGKLNYCPNCGRKL